MLKKPHWKSKIKQEINAAQNWRKWKINTRRKKWWPTTTERNIETWNSVEDAKNQKIIKRELNSTDKRISLKYT